MRIVLPSANERILLREVSWASFLKILEDLGDHRSGRVAYDRGTLELMSPSPRHERIKILLSRFLEALTEELHIEIQGVGSTTLLREDIQRGLEPDTSYYITNEVQVRGRTDMDLGRDPPPDLAVEVDVTRKSLDRFPIYAALGVPEVWRYREGVLEIYQLRQGGQYENTEGSTLFPGFPVREIARFLDLKEPIDDNRRVAMFRAWVRAQLNQD